MGIEMIGYWEACWKDEVWFPIEKECPGKIYGWYELAAKGSSRRDLAWALGDKAAFALEPRGMPPSPSAAWEHFCEPGDLHHHSWLTLEEVNRINNYLYRRENDWSIVAPSGNSTVSKIFVPGGRGRLTAQRFTGTLHEFVHPRSLEESLRLVFAFD
jgi:hypothetical protein